MSNLKPFKSNFVIAPGEYIEEHMEYYDYSYEKFAEICGCSVDSVKELVIEKKPLNLKLAKKLENELRISAETLMRIEKKYRLRSKPVVNTKKREKNTSLVDQTFTVAQQFG